MNRSHAQALASAVGREARAGQARILIGEKKWAEARSGDARVQSHADGGGQVLWPRALELGFGGEGGI